MLALRAAMARQIETAPRQHRLRTPQCPPLTRFVPEACWSEQEQAHMVGCAYCRMILGLLGETKPAREGREIPFPEPIRLPPKQRAAQDDNELSAKGIGEGGLEWRLDEDDGQVHFRVRTQEKRLSARTVAYVLQGSEDTAIRGSFELCPNADGWLVAEVAFSLAELHERLAGECQAIQVRVEANGAV